MFKARKISCSHDVINFTQESCEADNCCWGPVARLEGGDTDRDVPWCFYPSGYTRPPSVCDDLTFAGAADPGFTQAFYDNIYARYEANLNIEGSGAVVAAPDTETPGGSYYYHWMRDAGLSIKVGQMQCS